MKPNKPLGLALGVTVGLIISYFVPGVLGVIMAFIGTLIFALVFMLVWIGVAALNATRTERATKIFNAELKAYAANLPIYSEQEKDNFFLAVVLVAFALGIGSVWLFPQVLAITGYLLLMVTLLIGGHVSSKQKASA